MLSIVVLLTYFLSWLSCDWSFAFELLSDPIFLP
jgi:hypothetical protein